MRHLAVLPLSIVAIPWLAAAATLHGPADTAAAILSAELAFEAQSEHQGAAAAFGAVMDPIDGLAFNGTGAPARGLAAIIAPLQAQDRAGVLKWTPREVFASTGDMGSVWGDWRFEAKSGKAVTGRYVTVWRRDATGAWKVLIDIGNPDS